MSALTRPHLLYVAWGFPPCRGGGVYRALATANAFVAAGWDVTVITADREFFIDVTGADEALEAEVDPRIEIVRVPFTRPALETDRSKFSLFRKALPRVWWHYRKWLDQWAFPEPGYGPWRRHIEKAAELVQTRKPVDLVLATANPAVVFSVAKQLHAVYGVPYVIDYRDAWSLDVFSGRRLHSDDSRVGRWESSMMRAAAEVWFVNEPILEWHAAVYPEAASQFHVVANGWDSPPVSGPPHQAGEELRYGYLGTISGQVPMAELVAGWRAARSADPELARARLELHGYLGFYGSADPRLQQLLEDAASDAVTFGGPVSKTEVGELYASWDVLVLALGTGRYVTSGKVFEYVATGLPVVSVHDPDNAASDVLRGYPRWFPAASLAPADVAAALADAARAVRSDGPEVVAAAREFAARYQRSRQLEERISALERVVAGPPGQ